MALQLKRITRKSGKSCQHLLFDCVLDGEKFQISVELEKLKERFGDEIGDYRGLLISLLALYKVEQGRKIERLHFSIR